MASPYNDTYIQYDGHVFNESLLNEFNYSTVSSTLQSSSRAAGANADSYLGERNPLQLYLKLLPCFRNLRRQLLPQRDNLQWHQLQLVHQEDWRPRRPWRDVWHPLWPLHRIGNHRTRKTRKELSAARKVLSPRVAALAMVLVYGGCDVRVYRELCRRRCRSRLPPGDGANSAQHLLLRHLTGDVGVGMGDGAALGELVRTHLVRRGPVAIREYRFEEHDRVLPSAGILSVCILGRSYTLVLRTRLTNRPSSFPSSVLGR